MRKFLLTLYLELTKVYAWYLANVRPNHPALAPIHVVARTHPTRGHPGDLRRLY
jgi:hypothetical protein